MYTAIRAKVKVQQKVHTFMIYISGGITVMNLMQVDFNILWYTSQEAAKTEITAYIPIPDLVGC